jgi:DNA (cytosine-5)-methyltransferase 1
MNQPNAVDLFCGCGGISTGLRSAGFNIVAGVEIEPRFLATFKANFPAAHGLNLDLAKTSPVDFMELIGIRPGELDLLAGGPPCQGFSKNVPRSRRFLEDPKNMLVQTFIDYCEVIQPRMVLMENVAEMKNGFEQAYTQELVERLATAGYTVNYGVLLAADYGVPQRRRRAFFLGSRDGTRLSFPMATHIARRAAPGLFVQPHVSVWEAISDLPSLEHGQGSDPCEYASDPQSDFQMHIRRTSVVVRNHVARKLAAVQFARLSSLNPGEGLKQLPEELRPKSGYSGAYGRLTKEMVAATVTRWVFHPGSGRFGHPVDIRTVTMREAARLQAFPDDFVFTGSYNEQAAQIGNAVPPLLAQRVAESMLEQMSRAEFGVSQMRAS